MIISSDTKKALNKFQHFIMETLRKLIEENFLYLIKISIEIALIIVNGKKLETFSQLSGTRQECLFQHHTATPGYAIREEIKIKI